MRDLRELNFDNVASPVTDADLDRFQQQLGFRLPDAYRSFLKQVNGGNPDLDSFCLEDGEEWSAATFYHLTMDPLDGEDLLWALHTHRSVLPEGVFPIAYDGGGNQTCLDLRPNAQFGVVVWDHEVALAVRPAARTFEALIDALYLNPDYI